jgi:lipoprotein-releasing system permease protein
VAKQLADTTGLEVKTAWMDKNLSACAKRSKVRAAPAASSKCSRLITIVVGVASALLLTTFRRRPEIGIMRSFGISQRFVLSVFMLQGALIGIRGPRLAGCFMGWGFSYLLAQAGKSRWPRTARRPQLLGQYDVALLLAAAASIAAASRPARSASRIDPVEAIIAMTTPLLEVDGLRKVFVDEEFETPVLKGVTFALQRGETAQGCSAPPAAAKVRCYPDSAL